MRVARASEPSAWRKGKHHSASQGPLSFAWIAQSQIAHALRINLMSLHILAVGSEAASCLQAVEHSQSGCNTAAGRDEGLAENRRLGLKLGAIQRATNLGDLAERDDVGIGIVTKVLKRKGMAQSRESLDLVEDDQNARLLAAWAIPRT